MTPEERERIGDELEVVAKDFVNALNDAAKEHIFTIPQVADAFDKFQKILNKINISAHIAIDLTKLKIAYFPLGIGEPQLLVTRVSQFTDFDRKQLKALGMKLDADSQEPPSACQ